MVLTDLPFPDCIYSVPVNLSAEARITLDYFYWMEEKEGLYPLPAEEYYFKVSSDFHVRFDNAYYSVPKEYLHKQVSIRATADTVYMSNWEGQLLCSFPRATYKGQ